MIVTSLSFYPVSKNLSALVFFYFTLFIAIEKYFVLIPNPIEGTKKTWFVPPIGWLQAENNPSLRTLKRNSIFQSPFRIRKTNSEGIRFFPAALLTEPPSWKKSSSRQMEKQGAQLNYNATVSLPFKEVKKRKKKVLRNSHSEYLIFFFLLLFRCTSCLLVFFLYIFCWYEILM